MVSRDGSQRLTGMMRDTILQLCRANVVYGGHIEVDGIICISGPGQSQQIVVKVHEKLYRDSQSTPFHVTRDGPPPQTKTEEPDAPSVYPTTIEQHSDEPIELTVHNNRSEEREAAVASTSSTVPTEQKEDIEEKEDEGEESPVEDFGDDIDVEDVEEEAMDTEESCPQNSIQRQAPSMLSGVHGISESTHSKLRNLLTRAPLAKPHSIMPFMQRRPAFTGQSASTAPECKSCRFTFADSDLLKEHNEGVHGVFTCNFCFRTFTSRSNLDRHSRLHTGHKPYVCSICNKAFSRKDHLTNHAAKHAFKCGKCLKRFVDRDELKIHYQKDHGTVLTNVCDHCNKGFTDINVYTEHRKTHPDLNDKGRPRFQGFTCKVCSFTSGDRLQLLKHKQVHINSHCFFNCTACNETFMDPVQYSHHFVNHKDHVNIFECCICRQVCATYADLKHHEFGHLSAEAELHVCSLCNKCFHSQINLDAHMANHSPPKLLSCAVCSEKFTSEEELQKHEVDAKHTPGRRTLMKRRLEAQRVFQQEPPSDNEEEQQLECKEGEDGEKVIVIQPESPPGTPNHSDNIVIFDNPTPVIEISNVGSAHSSPEDVQSSRSSDAGSDWGTMAAVKTHNSAYSISIPSGSFICSICCAQFPAFTEYESHCFTQHYRHPCMYCEKTFAQKANRDRHVCIHTGEKPFACPECGEKFARGDKLKIHRMKSHSVEFASPWSRVAVTKENADASSNSADSPDSPARDVSERNMIAKEQSYITAGNNNNNLMKTEQSAS